MYGICELYDVIHADFTMRFTLKFHFIMTFTLKINCQNLV